MSHCSHWNRTKTNALAMAALVTLVMVNFFSKGFAPFLQVATTELSSIVEYANDANSSR
ncbi:MAG: hypothetical protein ACJ04O_10260 [Cellvibrionales bacterium]|nr:hypothetical protein [Porticoccaceae bacterium]